MRPLAMPAAARFACAPFSLAPVTAGSPVSALTHRNDTVLCSTTRDGVK